ncbi:hypothetical protein V2S66_17290 [Streptomyces sp. V4-01]|uniref:Integral membrane protein n=1 Tax=Actinacidiphila polyblastidii TaxID=3110430 RepID=A0ABU7PDD9_9ACTN|nr:hypothetical protein [Streptomyces sp. V4-01]
MNIRSLTRGDGAVIGAAVLLLIASFLPFYSVSTELGSASRNLWHSDFFPILPSVTLAALAAAAAVLVARSGQFAGRQLLGLSLPQWAVALSIFVGWTAVWSTLFVSPTGYDKGAGNWLTLIFGLAIAVAAPLSDRLPALKAPLMGAPKPAQQQPYGVGGAQPYGAAPQQAGYGYPGGAQSVDPGYAQGGAAPYGAAAQPAAAQAAAPAAEFSAFWFAVPVPRPLFAEDGAGGQIAELTPGTWYLAVDQRGPSLIAQTQDGRRGLLQDSSGIQRG